MPLYDYKCDKGHEFSVYESIKSAPLKTCNRKDCKAKAKRLIGSTSFILKGKGWYKDGY